MKKIVLLTLAFSVMFLIICKINSKVIVVATSNDSQEFTQEAITTSVTIPNEKCTDSYSETKTISEPFYIEEIPLPKELQLYTYNVCEDNDVSYELMLAVMKKESNYDINSIGYNTNGTYDSGLMQINSCNISTTEANYGITDLMDPYNNILVGVSMISSKIHEFGENGGLMAYNMGNGGYQDAVEAGITTSTYSQQVLSYKSEICKMDKTI